MHQQSDFIQRLRTITPNLPSFPPEADAGRVAGCKIHEMLSGTSISWNLLSQPEISCARWYNSNGTEFPPHVHSQREWLVVYQGSILITVGQEETRLVPGMSMVIEPNAEHSARFLEDTWYIAITIPKSKDWPHE